MSLETIGNQKPTVAIWKTGNANIYVVKISETEQSFQEWMNGQTFPVIEEDENPSGWCYLHDYSRWKNGNTYFDQETEMLNPLGNGEEKVRCNQSSLFTNEKEGCGWSGKLKDCVEKIHDKSAFSVDTGRDGYLYFCPNCGKQLLAIWTRFGE